MTDQPPSYQQALGSSTASQKLGVPSNSRIPPPHRRSMEDEGRDLPHGWLRQYDHTADHHYYVDTTSDPPRSIWHHPYDDMTYLQTLPFEERERVQAIHRREPSRDDIVAAESDVDDPDSAFPNELPPRPGKSNHNNHEQGSTGIKKYGRKLKDKLTDTTHEEREAERRLREQEEEEMYRRHQQVRRAMQQAWETKQPQLLGKDKDGKDVYIEPPTGGPYQQAGPGAYGYNPSAQGPYQQPNARFVPPISPFSILHVEVA